MEYMRDFDASSDNRNIRNHATGRKCDNPNCRGKLVDSIINFSEDLPEIPLQLAFEHADKADLCVVLGSSLTVTPANEIPEIVGKKAKLVIVNLQKTDLDKNCVLRIFGKSDQVMQLVMSKLNLAIPHFTLTRHLAIGRHKGHFFIQGVDEEGCHFSCLKQAAISETLLISKEPFLLDESKVPSADLAPIQLQWYGHYGEPMLQIMHDFSSKLKLYCMQYTPMLGEWKTSEKDPAHLKLDNLVHVEALLDSRPVRKVKTVKKGAK